MKTREYFLGIVGTSLLVVGIVLGALNDWNLTYTAVCVVCSLVACVILSFTNTSNI